MATHEERKYLLYPPRVRAGSVDQLFPSFGLTELSRLHVDKVPKTNHAAAWTVPVELVAQLMYTATKIVVAAPFELG